MKNFFQKRREAVGIVVYVAVIAALIFFVILPLLSRINRVKDQIQEEGIKQEIAEKQISDLPKMEEQYNFLLQKESLIDILLDRNDAVVLIEKLEKLSQDSGNEIAISVQDTAPQSMQSLQKNLPKAATKKTEDETIVEKLPSADYLQMKIVLTGNYDTIMKFIGDLESFEYYCDIVGIQIKQNEKVASRNVNSIPSISNTDDAEKEVENTNAGTLAASFDVVFYTKN